MTLGLIAGGSDLPRLISEHCQKHSIKLIIAGLKDSGVDETLPNLKLFPIAKVGAIISYFRDHGVTELIIAGSLKRPNFKTLIPDAKGLAVLSKIILKKLGDDALLKIIRSELESEGFAIKAVQDLIPELLSPVGSLALTQPNEDNLKSITLGWNAARFHGSQDLGQSVVVQNETILGLESEKGTDALLRECASIQAQDGGNPILIKLSKPQQDMALDAPTIGVRTIENLARLGYAGLVIEAHRTLIIDRARIIQLCDQHGLFLESYTDEDIRHRG